LNVFIPLVPIFLNISINILKYDNELSADLVATTDVDNPRILINDINNLLNILKDISDILLTKFIPFMNVYLIKSANIFIVISNILYIGETILDIKNTNPSTPINAIFPIITNT